MRLYLIQRAFNAAAGVLLAHRGKKFRIRYCKGFDWIGSVSEILAGEPVSKAVRIPSVRYLTISGNVILLRCGYFRTTANFGGACQRVEGGLFAANLSASPAYYGPSGPVIPLEVGRSFRCDVGREWVVMWAAFLVSP